MSRQITTTHALETWAATTQIAQDHLDVSTLYKYAGPSGLKDAPLLDIRHLSLCPKCMDTYKALCDYQSDLESGMASDMESGFLSEQPQETIFSFGMLQAASSTLSEPAFISSECKKFMLGIYPQMDDPDKALVVLETADGESDCKEMNVRVTDANGRLILNAIIHQGRAAGKIDNLDDIDLSTWSIVVSRPSDKGAHE